MAAHPVVDLTATVEPSGGAVADTPVAAVASAAVPPVAAVPTDEALDAVHLDASKPHCYQVAMELHAQCSVLLAFTHRGVRDQLERASLSVLLNTAEAMGSTLPPFS